MRLHRTNRTMCGTQRACVIRPSPATMGLAAMLRSSEHESPFAEMGRLAELDPFAGLVTSSTP